MGSTFKCARIGETRLRKAIPDELELWPRCGAKPVVTAKVDGIDPSHSMKNRVFQDYVDLVISGTSGINARKCRLVCVVLSDSPRHRRADPWARFASWPHRPPPADCRFSGKSRGHIAHNFCLLGTCLVHLDLAQASEGPHVGRNSKIENQNLPTLFQELAKQGGEPILPTSQNEYFSEN